ncbi:Hypothetical predicted protein, partial [Marmota monax]
MGGGAEMNLDGEPQMKLKEIIRGRQAELQEHKLNFRDLEEKFILCQSTVYTLANQFQKYQHHDNEDDDKEESLYFSCLSSLNSDLQEEEENDLQLDEKHFRYSGHPDSCDTQELVRSSVFPSHEPKVSCTVDGT